MKTMFKLDRPVKKKWLNIAIKKVESNNVMCPKQNSRETLETSLKTLRYGCQAQESNQHLTEGCQAFAAKFKERYDLGKKILHKRW